MTATHQAHSRLEHFPISFFAIVMGLAGTTIAVEKAQHLWGWSPNISLALLVLTALAYVGVAGTIY